MDIISTVGPSFRKKHNFKSLEQAGSSAFRFNSSHMDEELVIKQVEYIQEKTNAKTILDLKGHKIRISSLIKSMRLNDGEEILITSEEYAKNSNDTRRKLVLDVEFDFKRIFEKEKLFGKDGRITFYKQEILCDEAAIYRVTGGGELSSGKGITAPYIDRMGLKITDKDKRDIKFALENRFDILYLSYVVEKNNVLEVKNYIRKLISLNSNYKFPKIYSKIESDQGLENLKEILRVSDGIVLGRGDLYTEVSLLRYPQVENDVIKKMKKSKKDLIIATHVLPSMRKRSKPVTSEVSDLYKFLTNGVNGVVLVSETSVASNPYNAVKFAKTFIDFNTNNTNDTNGVKIANAELVLLS